MIGGNSPGEGGIDRGNFQDTAHTNDVYNYF